MTTYDIFMELTDASTQNQGKFFTFGSRASRAVTGPARLYLRWVKCFLTRKGTDASDTNYGTLFMDLFGGNVTNSTDLRDNVALAVKDCSAQITAQDDVNRPPPEERLASAVITAFTITERDKFSTTIAIKNTAGATFVFSAPTLATR